MAAVNGMGVLSWRSRAPAAPAKPGRRRIDKPLHGELPARRTAELLSAGTDVPGLAGHVAIERVLGSLRGCAGCFARAQHATRERGATWSNLGVVPESGTGELGLSGPMGIRIGEAQHAYALRHHVPGTG